MACQVLVISPHPDDEAIGCGGSLRRHVVDGDRVEILFLTSGEKGGHGRDCDDTRRIREAEAQAAASIIGVHKIAFWRERDGCLWARRNLIERLATTIDSVRPDLIYVPNALESHSDHRAAARLVRAARMHSIIKPLVLMFEVWTPLTNIDVVVDISRYVDEKLAAIRAYESQCEVLHFDEAMLGLARYRGEMFCWPKSEEGEGRYAEVFRKLIP